MTNGGGPLIERAVRAFEDGERVDVLLSRWLDEPRSASQQRLAAGDVAVDDRGVTKSRRLRAGQRVAVQPAPPPEVPPAPDPVPVRWQDEHLAVIAKPAGTVVHPGAGVRDGTLVAALRAMDVPLAPAGGDVRPGIVHRLDRGTSGVLVVAKTDAAYHALVALLRRRGVDREYWVLVDGVPDPPRATVEAPIARDPSRRTRFRVDPNGRRAVSHYDVEEPFGRAAVVTVLLETGRTHQVRVHLSAVGHPVAGDATYGASAQLRQQLGLARPALHARRLAFTHPLTGERVDVSEPLPADLLAALAILRG